MAFHACSSENRAKNGNQNCPRNRAPAAGLRLGREMNPAQPLTSGVYELDTSAEESALEPIERIQLHESDIITFHNTAGPNPSRPKSRGSEDSIAPWFVPNPWLVRWEARSTGSCPSPTRSGSEPATAATGASSPVKRKTIILGSPGNTLIFSTSRRYVSRGAAP